MLFDMKDAIARCNKVDGWIRPKEKEFLYQKTLEAEAEGATVEIGSWKGKSTVLLASAVKTRGRGKVYAVDPFEKPAKMSVKSDYDLWTQQKQGEHYTEFVRNIADQDVADVVVPIRAMSEDAIEIYKEQYNEPIRFLFIDGCHQRKFAQKDFDLWSPLVAKGGIIAFHDAWKKNKDFKDSAAIVAKNELIDSPNFEHGECFSIVWGKKL